MNNPDRAAMQARNGSWGTKMRNNIFINDQPNSIEVFNTSIYRLDASFNVVNTSSYTGMPDTLKSLAINFRHHPGEGCEGVRSISRTAARIAG
jgi:hypothetical protein